MSTIARQALRSLRYFSNWVCSGSSLVLRTRKKRNKQRARLTMSIIMIINVTGRIAKWVFLESSIYSMPYIYKNTLFFQFCMLDSWMVFIFAKWRIDFRDSWQPKYLQKVTLGEWVLVALPFNKQCYIIKNTLPRTAFFYNFAGWIVRNKRWIQSSK